MKAIAFDLGDTLLEYEGVPLSWEPLYPDALRALADHLRLAPAPAAIDAACAALRRYNTRLHPRTEEMPFSRVLAEVLRCFGADTPADELPCARAFFRVFQQRLRAFPDALPALASLRTRGLATAVFTDVPYGMPRELVLEDVRAAALEGACDILLTSRDVGFRKPAAAALAAVAQVLRCGPTDLAYVGNERKDVEAARAFGCRAILIDRAGRDPAWGQDQTVASLTEL